jgi:acetyl esterase/lipase
VILSLVGSLCSLSPALAAPKTTPRAAPAGTPSPPLVVPLWPGDVPGETGDLGPEKIEASKPGERKLTKLGNVSRPTITIHRPPRGKDTGASVIIAPGGGYYILAMDLEGDEVAAWLNSIGVTGIVLKYRVPRRPGTPKEQPPIGALQDAQRALSLVRSRAAEWGMDPNRIGMLGFSAGGHLTAWTSTSFDKRAYPSLDAVDEVSCRPDFAVLLYPAYLTEAGKYETAPLIRVSPQTPPMFLAHADDDGLSAENSALMYVALKRAKVRAELHVYRDGGHGFGLRPSADAISSWPARCADWMKAEGLLERKHK